MQIWGSSLDEWWGFTALWWGLNSVFLEITLGDSASRPCVVALSHFSRVQLFETLWTVTCQAPLSMEFSRQEIWDGLPFPSPRDLPDPEIEPGLLHCRQIIYQLSHQGSLKVNMFMLISLLSWCYLRGEQLYLTRWHKRCLLNSWNWVLETQF